MSSGRLPCAAPGAQNLNSYKHRAGIRILAVSPDIDRVFAWFDTPVTACFIPVSQILIGHKKPQGRRFSGPNAHPLKSAQQLVRLFYDSTGETHIEPVFLRYTEC